MPAARSKGGKGGAESLKNVAKNAGGPSATMSKSCSTQDLFRKNGDSNAGNDWYVILVNRNMVNTWRIRELHLDRF